VVECDSDNTANFLYEQCNDKELELSTTKLDLRFIPDDMEFEEEDLVDSSTKGPETHRFIQPTTTALSQSKTKNTFDLTDPRRLEITTKVFDEAEMDEKFAQNEFSQLIADSDSDDDFFEDEKEKGNALPVCAISMSSKQDDIDRYGEIWRMELKESWKTDPFSKRKISTDEDTSDENSSDSDNIVTQPKKKSLKKKKQHSSSESDEDKQEAKKGNKRRMRKKMKEQKEEEVKEDNFKLDLKDDRFSEVFTSSKFAPDPNHPQYKNTDNMQKLMKEKRERRKVKTVRKEKNVGGEQEKTDEAGKRATDNSNVESGKTNDEKNEKKRKASDDNSEEDEGFMMFKKKKKSKK